MTSHNVSERVRSRLAFPVCRSDTLQAHDPLVRRALCVVAAAAGAAVVVAVAVVAVVEVAVVVAVVAVVEVVAQ
jgi:hypothetical protein